MGVFTGTSGNDSLIGTTGVDTISGLNGDDTLDGSSGNDLIIGGAGADAVTGGIGTDTASYETAATGVAVNLQTGVHSGDALGDTFNTIEIWKGSGFADTLTSSTSISSTFQGGAGDDLFVVDSTSDVVSENASEGIDEVRTTSASYTIGANIENLTFIGSGGFSGVGNASNNTLTGGSGDDTLQGLGGADSFVGGGGTDTVTYSSSGNVSVNLATGVNLGDAAGDTFNSIEVIVGANGNDTLIGDAAANILQGSAGNDLIEGGAGADTLDGGAGTVDIASYAGAPSGIELNLATGTHTGDATGDVLTNFEIYRGSAFADTLTSSAAVNTNFQGGAGDDIYVLDSASDFVSENASEGTDEVRTTSATYTIGANVENLTFVGSGNFSGLGNASNNTLTGGAGDDTLQGLGGADSFVGSGGTDTVSYSSSSVVVVNLATGVNTGDALGDTFSSIEGILGSAGNDTLTGDAAANILQGGSGNDLIEGGAGSDTLDGGVGTADIASYAGASSGIELNLATGTHTGDAAGDVLTNFEVFRGSAFADTLTSSAAVNTNFQGGAGDDVFVLDSASDFVSENASEGTDEVRTTSATYTIGVNVENLTFVGSGNFSGLGNASNNTLTGGSGDDTLQGLGGADSFVGSGGTDTVSYSGSSVVVVNLATGVNTGDALGDTFNSIESILGSAGNDTLTGDAAANFLQGGSGNDLIQGGGGADILDGGVGTADIASYTGASSGIELNLATGTHTGDAAGDVLTNFEIFQGSAYGDTLTSSAALSTTFRGGAGDDVYVVDSTSDLVTENASEGTDEVRTTSASYTIGANVENLTFIGSGGFSGAGNASDNVLTGGTGADTLQGLGGADSFVGGGGTDTVTYAASVAGVGVNLATGVNTGDALGDTFNSIEVFVGSSLADTLTGAAGDDTIQGGSGNDVLEGGAGADVLDGGVGTADVASYASASAGIALNFVTGVNTGDAGGDVLTNFEVFRGSAYADTLTSTTTVNTTFQGGAGDDLFVVDSTSDIVTENGSEGTDEVRTTSASYTLGANLENLTFGGSGNFSGVGNASDNVLTGGSGNDTLQGLGGADTFVGGGGVDTVTYAGSAAGVGVNLATGVHTGDALGDTFSSISAIVGSTLADTLVGSAGSDSFQGGAGNDILEGGAGADTLDGGTGTLDLISFAGAASGASIDFSTSTYTGDGAGDVLTNFEGVIGSAYADTLTSSTLINTMFRGGDGDDVFIVDSASDAVTENASEGMDEVRTTSASYTLSANIENLTYLGAGNFNGVGNATANLITGGNGNDTLVGGGGADTLVGGSGNDVLSYSTSNGITLNLATGVHGGDAAGDVFSGIDVFQGSAGFDTMTGDSGSNNLQGSSGNDLIEGGDGADTLDGGAGVEDIVSWANAGSAISFNLATGVHTGEAAGDILSGFEIYLGSAYADTMTGNTAGQNFMGGAGADVFVGGGGSDQVWYLTSTSGVTVDLSTGTGSGGDAAGDSYTGISGAVGTHYDDVLTGNNSANIFFAECGNDTVMGYGGDDQITLYMHNGQALFGPDICYVDGGDGNDTIFGSTEDGGSTILGGNGDDLVRVWKGVVDLGAGNDTLTMPGADITVLGGAGNDVLNFQGQDNVADGGEGSDTYTVLLSNALETVYDSGTSGTDTIVLLFAASSSDFYVAYDAINDIKYITTDQDMADGRQDGGVVIFDWSLNHIEVLKANDGSFVNL